MKLVRKERLELSRVAPLDPKSSASTNSATLAVSSAAPSSAAKYNAKSAFAERFMHGRCLLLFDRHGYGIAGGRRIQKQGYG